MTNSYGNPIDQAYEVDDAIHIPCPDCGAAPEEYCEDQRGVKKIPHTTRLAIAYVTNNPEGRRKQEARARHLAEHRKNYSTPWQRKTA